MRVRVNIRSCNVCGSVFCMACKYIEEKRCWVSIGGWTCEGCGMPWSTWEKIGLERETNVPDGALFVWGEK